MELCYPCLNVVIGNLWYIGYPQDPTYMSYYNIHFRNLYFTIYDYKNQYKLFFNQNKTFKVTSTNKLLLVLK